jgi:hypothetical protein
VSYFIVYSVEGDGGPAVDGDDVASGKGWSLFAAAVDPYGTEYPDLWFLTEEGQQYPAGDVAGAETDLSRFLDDQPGKPAAHVLSTGRRLLAALKARPAGCIGVVITDGTEPGDSEDDDES